MEKPGINTIVDFAHGRYAPEEALGLLQAIENDEDASAQLDLVVEVMNVAAEREDNVFTALNTKRAPLWKRFVWWVEEKCEANPILYPAGALSVVGGVLLFIMVANQLWGNRYEELTGIDRTAFGWNVRGPGEGDVTVAYHYFTKADYEESMKHLERYLRTYPKGELVEYVHYMTGVVCLLSSRHSFLSLFPTYDGPKVIQGLAHLDEAIRTTTNLRLIEESRFVRAKGFLMLRRKDLAIAELDLVCALDGHRRSEAIQMIERLRAINP